jgi:hypothetical protein
MQTTANTDPWIQAASGNLNISTADREKASRLFHEFKRLDWWSDYSDDGDVRYREMIRTGNALDQLKEFAGGGKDHAYLASRIYDKTAPAEFGRPRAADGINRNAWYVPADEETIRMIDARAEERAAWQAPAFSKETIAADPWTAVYLPIPEKANLGLLTEAHNWARDLARYAEGNGAFSQPLVDRESHNRADNIAAATARTGELEQRVKSQLLHQIEVNNPGFSRWTGEPLGAAAGQAQKGGIGQSH